MAFSPARLIGVLAGSIAILAIGVYTPAMLVGPLPKVHVHATTPLGTQSAPKPTLPATGSSAVALVAPAGPGSPVQPALAMAGDPKPVPIGGAAKLVTVLTVVDSLPLPKNGDGPAIRIAAPDYQSYLNYAAAGARTLQVSPGETWTERDVVRAILLASSNNHADTLARWAFGTTDAYATKANAWLTKHGFASTHVTDATGLSGDDTGTASDVARLGAMLLADPELAPVFAPVGGGAAGGANGGPAPSPTARDVPDVVGHLGDQGIRALSRSFTDQAGLTFVFVSDVAVDGQNAPERFVGAMVRMPDYATLDAAVLTLHGSLAAAARPVDVISAGASYGTVEAAWGQRAKLVAATTRSAPSWALAAKPAISVTRFRTAADGHPVGEVTVKAGTAELTSPLTLDGAIGDPGPVWRLTHPADVIGAFLADQRH